MCIGPEDRVHVLVGKAVAMPDAAAVDSEGDVELADPERSGTALIAIFACFCATTVSQIDNLGRAERVLRDRAWDSQRWMTLNLFGAVDCMELLVVAFLFSILNLRQSARVSL